jgi:phosphopentomutase
VSNADGMQKLADAAQKRPAGLIFCNLVDFDMLYGHRKDVEGFAKSLEEFDAELKIFLDRLLPSDLLMLTADHGCDPDPRWPTTDHSREYVPVLAYSPKLATHAAPSKNLGTRETLSDLGQTVAENFATKIPHGQSFLSQFL